MGELFGKLYIGFMIVAYIMFIKNFFDIGNDVCGYIFLIPGALFIYHYYIGFPKQEQKRREEEAQKQRELEIWLMQLDRQALESYNYRCSICGSGKSVIVVDSRTFAKSNNSNSRRITVCENCQIDKVSPTDFERLIGKAFEKKGYEVKHTGGSGDGGIDLICRKGNELIIVQCKRYKGKVGISAVRDFYGALLHSKASKGYIITTGGFPASAYSWVYGKPIELIGKEQLAKLITE